MKIKMQYNNMTEYKSLVYIVVDCIYQTSVAQYKLHMHESLLNIHPKAMSGLSPKLTEPLPAPVTRPLGCWERKAAMHSIRFQQGGEYTVDHWHKNKK